MTDLKEDLDRVLRTVPIGMAPVEQAKDQGRRIRTRRRATVLAGTLAVVAVAAGAGYPAFTKTAAAPAAKVTTSAKPTPATTPTNWPGTRDPVLTETPAVKATHGPDGLVAAGGVIAAGTLGNNRWQAVLSNQGSGPISSSNACTDLSVNFSPGTALESFCPGSEGNLTDAAHPVAFVASTSDGTDYASYGQASSQVNYLTVTFTDGQQLKLTPVILDGIRFFTWVAPLSMPVASVVVHLGGPYGANGQTETAVPFNLGGQPPIFNLTQKAGEASPPRAAKVVGSVTIANEGNVTVTAYEGPWGTCLVADPGGPYCAPGQQLASNTDLLGWTYDMNDLYVGSVPLGAAEVRIAYADYVDGTSVVAHTETVKPVHVGNEDLFVFPTQDGKEYEDGWAAYNASGELVASSD